MTDEEMAEEIANKRCQEIGCFGHCNFSSPKHHRCGEWHREYNCALEGLKAGRPQWHDLRKDPKDVPDEGTYLVVWQNARGYGDTMIMRYEEDDEEKLHWIDGEGDCWDDDVIAWRDFPEFEEAD
jgi:hypothetical protein